MATKARTTKTATRKPPSQKIEDKAQYERFREFAREVEADGNTEAFDRAFRKAVPPKGGASSSDSSSKRRS